MFCDKNYKSMGKAKIDSFFHSFLFQSGRKLMPRCIPVAQKVRVNNVDSIPAEDEIHAYLFTSEDID